MKEVVAEKDPASAAAAVCRTFRSPPVPVAAPRGENIPPFPALLRDHSLFTLFAPEIIKRLHYDPNHGFTHPTSLIIKFIGMQAVGFYPFVFYFARQIAFYEKQSCLFFNWRVFYSERNSV
ncbi:hypothetical protein M8494_09555 [Serratia ureilytica]